MPKCKNKKLDFGRLGRRVIEADFDGADLSSEAGVLLLRRMDQRLGLCASAARALGDGRQRGKVRHSLASMLTQRVAAALHKWLLAQRQLVPDGSATAKAIDYSSKRWKALTRYIDVSVRRSHLESAIGAKDARVHQNSWRTRGHYRTAALAEPSAPTAA